MSVCPYCSAQGRTENSRQRWWKLQHFLTNKMVKGNDKKWKWSERQWKWIIGNGQPAQSMAGSDQELFSAAVAFPVDETSSLLSSRKTFLLRNHLPSLYLCFSNWPLLPPENSNIDLNTVCHLLTCQTSVLIMLKIRIRDSQVNISWCSVQMTSAE